MRTFILFFLFSSFSSFGQRSTQALLYDVGVIDVETGNIRSGAAVLIQGDQITEIGDSQVLKRRVKEGDQIDGQGKFLIPGLWDMHVHFEGAELVEDNKLLFPVFLAYGITTVRDCASDLGEQVLQWREEIASNKLIGPPSLLPAASWKGGTRSGRATWKSTTRRSCSRCSTCSTGTRWTS